MRDLYYERYGYDEVITPQIFDASLWKTSGHYEHYREHMFFTEVDGREYAVKPMNCPSHCLIFSEGRHSYRELPIRMADFGRLHRYELSGATAGLTRGCAASPRTTRTSSAPPSRSPPRSSACVG